MVYGLNFKPIVTIPFLIFFFFFAWKLLYEAIDGCWVHFRPVKRSALLAHEKADTAGIAPFVAGLQMRWLGLEQPFCSYAGKAKCLVKTKCGLRARLLKMQTLRLYCRPIESKSAFWQGLRVIRVHGRV